MEEREQWCDQFAMGRFIDKQAAIDQRLESYVIHRSRVNPSTDILYSASNPSSSRWDTRAAMWLVFVSKTNVNSQPFLPIEVREP